MPKRIALNLRTIGLVIAAAALVYLMLRVGWAALLSSAGLTPLPFDLDLLDQRLPVIFRFHMASSGLALLLIGAAIAFRRHRAWHRPAGRAAACAVLVGGLTALPSALYSVALPAARAGFFAQGIVWLALLGAGWRAIRRRDIARHKRFMLAMAAVATGAIWLRLGQRAAGALALPADETYAVIAWAAWLLPLAFVWVATRGVHQATA